MFRLASSFGIALVCATAFASFPSAAPAAPKSVSKMGAHEIVSYVGKPDLPLTTAVVVAGGGPGNFSSVKLVHVLAGPLTGAEVKKLTAEFGAKNVSNSLATITFLIDDAVRVAVKAGVKLPPPNPSPKNGKALAKALYHDGLEPSGAFDVGYMLEHLITHPIHMQVMRDADRSPSYGAAMDAETHVVLTQMIYDLRSAYHL